MPSPRLTRLSSICMCVRSRETFAAYESSCPLGSLLALLAPGAPFSLGLSCGLSRVIASPETLSTLPWRETIAGEGKGIDLDLGVLARTHEADVAVRYHGLDLELALLRHQHQQSLRRGDHAADGMDGELLHHSIHRRGQRLELGALLDLGHVLHETGRLCLDLVELVEQGAAEFRDGLRVGLDDCGDGRFGFLQL